MARSPPSGRGARVSARRPGRLIAERAVHAHTLAARRRPRALASLKVQQDQQQQDSGAQEQAPAAADVEMDAPPADAAIDPGIIETITTTNES